MPLITLRNIQLSFGAHPILDGVNLSIDAGERLCLVGRNGTGKSTLMKMIAGEIQPEDGEIEKTPTLRVARLEQEVPGDDDSSVYQMVARGLGEQGDLLAEFTRLSLALDDASDDTLKRFEQVQQAIEAAGAWDLGQKVDTVLSRLTLDGSLPFAGLSGGMKRRVLLAQALVQEPDLLLLDEPTNHLDIDSIRWLEEFLKGSNLTLLFITHDRAFVRALATRIIEMDRGQLTSWPGDYQRYLTGKQAQLDAEEKSRAEFDKKLSQEERWIRQGIKARRTRNEGRVRALKSMREEYAQRRQRMGQASFNMQDAERSGKVVIEARDLCHREGEQVIVDHFDLTVMRGDRIGIIGANGCGKSTLLRILLGRLTPDSGTVKQGTNLQIAWFDQLRESLNEEQSVLENVVEGSDFIEVNGKSKHVMSYLQDFLFEPARARQPVKALSGGERNRLLLARLFTRPFNLLVLDEPTNDLDVETLELLEEQLMGYQGTLLLVSHDREFLDQVVTSTLVFEDGGVHGYVGGYQDWLRQRPQPKTSKAGRSAEKKGKAAEEKKPANKPVKRSYKDQRELDALPGRIEQLETDIAALHEQMADPAFFKQDPDEISAANERLAALEAELAEAFERWSSLEDSGN